MQKSAFISRTLAEGSHFRSLLLEAGFDVFGQSLLEFEPIAFSSPSTTDWVFFYSARSVDFFFEGLQLQRISPAAFSRFAALGKGTAKAFQKWSVEPAFTGSGKPEETAAAFERLASGKTVLFPRAEQSRQSVQRLLSNSVKVVDLVVYRNRIDPGIEVPFTDYAAITSPLNAKAYRLKRMGKEPSRIVAIGRTTARALEALDIPGFRVAGQSSEQAMAETILEWEQSR